LSSPGRRFSSSSLPGISPLSSPGRRAGREAVERRDPVIHEAFPSWHGRMDCRIKSGNDKETLTNAPVTRIHALLYSAALGSLS
jgi:hypothetical protein